MDALALNPQRLAAGGQDEHVGRFAVNPFGHRRRSADEVLTAVEDQQQASARHQSEQAGHGVLRFDLDTDRRRNREGEEFGIHQGPEIDEVDGAAHLLPQRVPDRDRNGGLSQSTRAHNADEAVRAKEAGQLRHIAFPTHDAFRNERQTDLGEGTGGFTCVVRERGHQVVPTGRAPRSNSRAQGCS